MRGLPAFIFLLWTCTLSAQKSKSIILADLTIDVSTLDGDRPLKDLLIIMTRDDKEKWSGFTNDNGQVYVDTCEHFFVPGHDYEIAVQYSKYHRIRSTLTTHGQTRSQQYYKNIKLRETGCSRQYILVPVITVEEDKYQKNLPDESGIKYLLDLMSQNPGIVIRLVHVSPIQKVKGTTVIKRLNHIHSYLLKNGIHPKRILQTNKNEHRPGRKSTEVAFRIVSFDFHEE